MDGVSICTNKALIAQATDFYARDSTISSVNVKTGFARALKGRKCRIRWEGNHSMIATESIRMARRWE